jgi:hypothetical protein
MNIVTGPLALSYIRRLVGDLSPRMTGFKPRPDHVGFVLGILALVEIFLRVLWFPLMGIVPPPFHPYSFIHKSLML